MKKACDVKKKDSNDKECNRMKYISGMVVIVSVFVYLTVITTVSIIYGKP